MAMGASRNVVASVATTSVQIGVTVFTRNFVNAITVATTAWDADSIFCTLMRFEQTSMVNAAIGRSTFLGTVTSKFPPEGFHTLRRYLETTSDINNVVDLLLKAQASADAGSAIVKRSFEANGPRQKLKLLAKASRIYSLDKESGFQKTCTDEQTNLLKDQKVLRTKYGQTKWHLWDRP